MNLERSWVRGLVVFALGLAAIGGLSSVLEALSLPTWLIRLAVLAVFVVTVGLGVIAGIQRQSPDLKRADGFDSA